MMHVHEYHEIIDIISHSIVITGFVLVMMLVLEYVNVLTRGNVHLKLAERRWGQYVLATLLGALPGCLGSFAIVSMFSHGVLSLGALFTAMVATTGDEAFVMLALFPRKAVFLICFLMVLGIISGWVIDKVIFRQDADNKNNQKFEVHKENIECFAGNKLLLQWKHCSSVRGLLVITLSLFILAIITGQLDIHERDWIRITLLIVSLVAFFIVSTVPDHFLEEHLWEHVVKKHIPMIFMWVSGTLLIMFFLSEHLPLDGLEYKSEWIVLLVACIIGLIPQSGPHMVIVTLYFYGKIPLSVLIANSIVQEGHGLLPMLAHSRRVFLGVKTVKFIIGLLIGALLLALGY